MKKLIFTSTLAIALASKLCAAVEVMDAPAQAAAAQEQKTEATTGAPAAQDSKAHAEQQKMLADSAKASEEWVKYIDNGNYEESWDHAAMTFQLKIPKKSWVTILDATRKPYGSVTSRKILEQRPAVDPQGLPKGNYMVIFYSTSFASKADSNELVTLVQNDEGQWKVLTYLVK